MGSVLQRFCVLVADSHSYSTGQLSCLCLSIPQDSPKAVLPVTKHLAQSEQRRQPADATTDPILPSHPSPAASQTKATAPAEAATAQAHALPTPLTSAGLKEWTFEDLAHAQATNGFASAAKMGEGGFGPVYRGRLDDQDVAIKVLSEQARTTTNEQQRKDMQSMFDAEVRSQHQRRSCLTISVQASA